MAKIAKIDADTLEIDKPDPVYNRIVGTINMFTDEFFVFVDDKHQVWWYATDAWGKVPEWFGKVISRVAELEAVPTSELSEDHRQTYACLIADGVARALERDRDAAFVSFDLASKYVKARLSEKARGWYLGSAAFAIFLTTLLMVGGWALACKRGESCHSDGCFPAYCVGMGVLGACFSIITRLGKLDVDPEAGRALNIGESLARIATGAIAAFVVYLAVRAKLIAPTLLDGSTAGLMLVAFAAGASERLVPSLIQTVEGLTNKSAPPREEGALHSSAPEPPRPGEPPPGGPPALHVPSGALTPAKATPATLAPLTPAPVAPPRAPPAPEASKVSEHPSAPPKDLPPAVNISKKEPKR